MSEELLPYIFLCAGVLIGAAVSLFYVSMRLKRSREALTAARITNAALERSEELKNMQLDSAIAEEKAYREAHLRLEKQLSTSEAARAALLERVSNQQQELAAMNQRLTQEFKLIAGKVLHDTSKRFKLESRDSLDVLLHPLKERIAQFEKRVETTHTEQIEKTAALSTELKQLQELSKQMSTEAENLTRALKNDSKTQGNWGEMILESILEKSGLVKNREYFLQQSHSSEGRRFQPDAVINLPNQKFVIVDSKVSLTAFSKYAEEPDEALQEKYLKEHLVSIRTHVRRLAEKQYQEVLPGENLDFILLFIPIEPAFLTAIRREPNLFTEAHAKGIVLVCPSTLIASLMIISSTWKHERQNKNARDIAERGKKMLEKFKNFAEDLEKLGAQLHKTVNIYDEARAKLSSGRGNLITQAQKLEDLGVKSAKKLPPSFELEE